jgi:NAD(P)H-dependent FMN reductase
MAKVKVLCFAGSLRKHSYNKKLVKIAMDAAQEAGAKVTFVDLKEYPMPVYDADLEEANGIPESVLKFKKLMKQHQAFLISSPEYNSSIPGALKNVIDWASRPAPGENKLECFAGKIAGIMSASPGGLGGLRGLTPLRSILDNIGTMVLPEQHGVPHADKAFDANGKLLDKKMEANIKALAKRLVDITTRLTAEQTDKQADKVKDKAKAATRSY